ncbi:MAG: hypothetical protein IT542_10975 [Rubellimicrobium sp.]|nr:hypothetical protein [Rubellimicrobium sp.]
MPDYGKQKSGNANRGAPGHREHNAPGGRKNPFGTRPDKTALLARMKEQAQKAGRKEPETGEG